MKPLTGFVRWPRALLVLWLVTGSTLVHSAPPQQLDAWESCLETSEGPVPVTLEHAATNEQRRWGLMERPILPANGGMLFFYDSQRPGSAGFWMYRTRIALDIAWLDKDGVIVAMDTMTPCDTERARDCPTWKPGVPHQNVLEMNAGFFEKHHVDVGDNLVASLEENTPCLPASTARKPARER
ncbi:DUF192 domain-containing protein [Marinobacter bryozoorum]|uniref:DUF192 domain-containing protein n=1 Tax=Marinobacter bryozoorum TaxID=256324 RepID=UPI002004A8D4|nr:DUF192 domain-containing protein [Marinobacter bryozoorum]MCK7543063.1 DUF192 domain-containing protein [Marinobacter bryozoorum]